MNKRRFFQKIFVVVFLSVISLSAIAQKEKNWLSISLGPAIPFNDFAKKTITDTISHSGFAKTGFSFNLAYTHQLANTFGITVMFSGNGNNSDTHAMAQEISRLVKSDIEIGDFTYDGQFGRWNTGMLLAGPNLNFLLAHHLFLEVRGLIGVGMGKSPEYDYKILLNKPYNNIHEIDFKQQSDNAVAFAWNVGLGFKYHFYNRMFVRINLDYSGTDLNYKDLNFQLDTPNNNTGVDYINRETSLSVQTDIMQVTGGVGYLF